MTFLRNPDTRRLIDPDTGEELRSERLHYQDQRWFQTIFSADGKKAFEAIFLVDADGSLANPAKAGDQLLVSATAYDDEGRSSPVIGPHRNLDRIVENLGQHTYRGKPFIFRDERTTGIRPVA